MTGITIPQLPDGATLNDTDLLEITRTAADGTQTSMRVSASYILAWLTGKDLSQAEVTPAGSETAASLASTIAGLSERIAALEAKAS